LRSSKAARDLADVAAVDPDLAQKLIDQRRLRTVAQRRVDDAVGEAAASVPLVARAAVSAAAG
jgi:hypothetical protein